MANGTKFGRKPKLSDYQRKEALKRAAGETLAGHCQVVRRRRQHDLTAWLIHDWGFAVHTRARRLAARPGGRLRAGGAAVPSHQPGGGRPVI